MRNLILVDSDKLQYLLTVLKLNIRQPIHYLTLLPAWCQLMTYGYTL